MCLSRCGCAFICVFFLQPCTRPVQRIDVCVRDTIAAVNSRHTAALWLWCCPKESEGEYPYPVGPSSKYVPCFISSRDRGREGGVGERPLFQSFVYVRSGSRVLGEQRSLGMLGQHTLGIICSSLACTAYSRSTYTVGHRL